MDVDRNGLEVLPRHECLALLAGSSLGRIAITARALPVVIPVEFALHRDGVVLRSAPDTQVASAGRAGMVVAFEADDVVPGAGRGWSVSVTGTASVVTDPGDIAELQALPLRQWAADRDGDIFVRLLPVLVTGRRFPSAAPVPPGAVPVAAATRPGPAAN